MLEKIGDRVHQHGFVFLSGWDEQQTTLQVGQELGVVVDMDNLLPQAKIPTVQTLKPRRPSQSPPTHYSGTYGLSEFPLHTDLAHWAQPPRYFLLRCQRGSAVTTNLLSFSAVSSALDQNSLSLGVARPRNPPKKGRHCLLPLRFLAGHSFGYRWDPLFLIPMNAAARRVATAISSSTLCKKERVSIGLENPGDTLIIDNWRLLHGRSPVPEDSLDRELERIYLSELRV